MIFIFPLQDTFIVSISLTHYFTFNFKIEAVLDNSFDPIFGETKKMKYASIYIYTEYCFKNNHIRYFVPHNLINFTGFAMQMYILTD